MKKKLLYFLHISTEGKEKNYMEILYLTINIRILSNYIVQYLVYGDANFVESRRVTLS